MFHTLSSTPLQPWEALMILTYMCFGLVVSSIGLRTLFDVAFNSLFELNWVLDMFWIAWMMFMDTLQLWILLCWMCFHLSVLSLFILCFFCLSCYVCDVHALLYSLILPKSQKGKCGRFWWVIIFLHFPSLCVLIWQLFIA